MLKHQWHLRQTILVPKLHDSSSYLTILFMECSVVTMRQQSSSLQIHIASPSLLFWYVDYKDFCKYDISVTINTSILRKKLYKISGNVCSIFCRGNSHDTGTAWISSNIFLRVYITPLNNLNINMNHHASVSTLDEFLIYAEFTNVFTESLW